MNMLSRRATGSSSSSSSMRGTLSLWSLAALSCALLVALTCTTPASAFLVSPRPFTRSAKHVERLTPVYGIKRKVKVEMEENFSGKVVEPAGAATSMFGNDANALFDVIEKNKKKAAEAAAAIVGGGDEDGDEEEVEREGEGGGDANNAGESGEGA